MHMSRTTCADTFVCDVGGFQEFPYVGKSVNHQRNQGRGVGCESKVRPHWRVNRSGLCIGMFKIEKRCADMIGGSENVPNYSGSVRT